MMSHGADIYKYAKIIDCNPSEIIDFSSNINLYQPEIKLNLNTTTIAMYPDPNYTKLKKIIAKKYEIQSSQIALFNGATAAIHTLLNSLKRQDVYLYEPLFGEYEKAAKKKNIYRVNRITDIEGELTEDSIVVFVNPSTPEGEYYDLEELFESWMSANCTIILDESFLEFEELPSLRAKINDYKKLYIIQSFSKFYSCAGVRVGAIFSHKKNIKKLPSVLWNISALDSEFLKQRLVDEEFMRKSKELHKTQKEELKAILENSSLFDEIVESQTNFILTHTAKGEELFTHLLEHKILVRECQSFTYLDKNWLRFAVKSKEDQQKLEEALSAFS